MTGPAGGGGAGREWCFRGVTCLRHRIVGLRGVSEGTGVGRGTGSLGGGVSCPGGREMGEGAL